MVATDSNPAILLGGAVNALSAARSLGSKGITVYVLPESTAAQPVQWSRFVSPTRAFPGGDVQAWWHEWFKTGPVGAAVLPTSDHGLEFIARNRNFLEELGYHPVEANDRLLLAMLDKGETYRVAKTAGIEAPLAVRVRCIEELDMHDFALPCAVKPTNAHHRPPGFRARKAEVVRSRQELEAAIRPAGASDAGVVVTEVVSGADDAFCSYYTYMIDGEPLFHYTKRKLRQYPIHFGMGTYHESDDVPEARELGLRLFRAAGLVGLGNVEFKRDVRDGRLKLIECNLRLTAADAMIRGGGLDLPHLLYERALGRPAPPIPPIRLRTRQWHPSEDVRAFVQYRRAGELATAEWVRSVLRRTYLPLFSLSDPTPSLANAFVFAHRLLRLMRRSLTGRGRVPS